MWFPLAPRWAAPSAAGPRARHRPRRLSTEAVALCLALHWSLTANLPLLRRLLADRSWLDLATWAQGTALLAGLVVVHALIVLLFASRWTFRPWATALTLVAATAGHFIEHYGVVVDPSMVRNVLRTHAAEAGELLGGALAWTLLWQATPALLLIWGFESRALAWHRALRIRLAWLAGLVVVLAVLVLAMFPTLAAQVRLQREVRYQVTPANVVWSLARALSGEARAARAGPRQPIGLDAVRVESPAGRPRLVVLVVGETARAANWGLAGYARQTTPKLAALPVVSFTDVTSCGTNTEVSLPCMFAPVGRRDYDEDRIRGSESLLHLVARAGVDVLWRDNQSGCKGVCDGLPVQQVSAVAPEACREGRCLDEGLLEGLDDRVARTRGTQLLVLHMLGNHGPSYHRRYPADHARFQPACVQDDLRRCTREEIVNAFDNALLYTDTVLSRLHAVLQRHQDHVDTAMVYLSDHGESLGEHNLYLHGLPWAIAPQEQKKVPMLMWVSKGLSSELDLDLGCLHERARQPASHDHLFHSLLSLLGVRTQLHDARWDLLAPCRTGH